LKNKKSDFLTKTNQLLLECRDFIENIDIQDFTDIDDLNNLDRKVLYYLKKLLKISNIKYLTSKIDTDIFNDLFSNIKKIKLELNNNAMKFLNNINHTNFDIEDIYKYKKNNVYNMFFTELYNLYCFNVIDKPKFLNQFNENPKDDYYTTRKIKRHFIIHFGPTNTGKTYEALKSLEVCENGVYLAPLRLLAIQVYDFLTSKGVVCNLRTGEEEILYPNATVNSQTIEKLEYPDKYDVVIIDEAQMISDSKRGWTWTKAILGINADRIYICCSSNAVSLITSIIEDLSDTFEIIEHKRNTPLVVEREKFVFPDKIQEGDALIVFSRIKALQVAASLKEIGINSSILYGNLPPESKKQQFKRFLERDTKVLVTTDAIGMGVNLPIRRVVFLDTRKFDGYDLRFLTSTEIKQISGRAGRLGIFDKGFVNCLNDKGILKQLLNQEDVILESAYIMQSEYVLLNDKKISLYKKLVTWKKNFQPTSLYKKADISVMQYLLLILIREEFNLSDNLTYKMITIPFDTNNSMLVELWLNYCKNIYNREDLEFPKCSTTDLETLETYYKSLDLYYHFIKSFNIKNVELDKINYEKSKTSDLIDLELIDNIKKHKKVCKKCGCILPWNSLYNYCENCYYTIYVNNDYFEY